jgi:hypothetical protein
MRDLFYSVGIILTFVLGAWNVANNYRLSRPTAFINTVTAERVKWIDKLRENISTFCSLLFTWEGVVLLEASVNIEQMKEIHRLQSVIRLQLNPAGEHDKEIERLILALPDLTDKKNELYNALRELVIESQKLLKEEWDKVKEESKRGDLKDAENCLERILRKANDRCLRVTSRWASQQ